MTIIKPSTAFKAGADWVSATIRSYMTDQTPIHVDTVADVRDNDFEKARLLYVVSKTAFYRLNLSSGAADDGDTVLRDNMGRRYVKVPGSDGAKTWNVQVDDLDARDAYDDEDAGFVVLVSDTGDGRAALYTMGDGGSADWIGPAYLAPAEAGGDLSGPDAATSGNLPIFDGATGKVVKDSGKSLADLAPAGNYLRDALINVLPDSGRFASDTNIAVGSFAFPSYFVKANGTTSESAGKFIANNNDYGGSAGALAATVKDLVDEIRSSAFRRYGPEFHVAQMTMGSGTSSSFVWNGTTYILSTYFNQKPRFSSQTFHFYLRSLDAAVLVNNEGTQQIYIVDGVQVTPRFTVSPADGWVSITVQDATDPHESYGYIPRPFMIYCTAEGHRYQIACPALMPGIVDVDDNVGMVPGFNIWL